MQWCSSDCNWVLDTMVVWCTLIKFLGALVSWKHIDIVVRPLVQSFHTTHTCHDWTLGAIFEMLFCFKSYTYYCGPIVGYEHYGLQIVIGYLVIICWLWALWFSNGYLMFHFGQNILVVKNKNVNNPFDIWCEKALDCDVNTLNYQGAVKMNVLHA